MSDDLTERMAEINAKRAAYLKRHPDKSSPIAGCRHENAGVVEPVADPAVYACRDCGWMFIRETRDGRTILTAVPKGPK